MMCSVGGCVCTSLYRTLKARRMGRTGSAADVYPCSRVRVPRGQRIKVRAMLRGQWFLRDKEDSV